ncbi:MAG: CopG family transcriptional regulator [Myxococcota bacterium]
MRTTVDIDDPILRAVKSLAAQRGESMGRVVSDLLARALVRDEARSVRNGLPVFTPNAESPPATLELVNRLRDGDEA